MVYDANVLYPNALRDILIRVAQQGVFRARWTEQILDEAFRNIKKNRPDIDPTKLDRTRALMCSAVEDCLVSDYEDLIGGLTLPDLDDRHVLAAAIKAGAQVIVTDNRKHFPQGEVGKYDIAIQGADDFLCDVIDLDGARVHQAVTLAAGTLKNPPRTVDDVLDSLARSGAPTAAALLRR